VSEPFIVIEINMSLKEIPKTRFREIYGGRRIEDKAVFGGELTQPLTKQTGAPIEYEQLPLLSETCLDFGRMFNRLNVKKFDGKLIGQTLDREEILAAIDPRVYMNSGQVVAPNTRNMWNGRPNLVYGNAGIAGTSGFLAAQGKSGLYADGTDLAASNDISSLSVNQRAQLQIRGKAGGTSITLSPRVGTQWIGQAAGSASDADKFGKWAESRFNYSLDTGVLVGDATLTKAKETSMAGDMYMSGHGSSTLFTENELILDYMANNLVHSSALSFLNQYGDALINVASQTQYLASELVGFYEKGLKGDFLRHYSADEVTVMFALVELGAALRRQVVVRNTIDKTVSDTLNLNGAISPFFMYVDKLGTNSVKRMYTPWWLTMLVDRHYFEYDETVDDVRDIHREDLFQGIRVLLEAASLEYGMIVKSTGTPYLSFFKDFESATLPDYSDLSSVPSLRSLLMAGYSSAEAYASFDDPDTAGFSFFKEFLANNRIVETERLDLQKDYASMNDIAVITGDMFKMGQQLLGDFEYTTHHRLTRFGSKSIDVKVKPDMCWRPLSYRAVYQSESGSDNGKLRVGGTPQAPFALLETGTSTTDKEAFLTAYLAAGNDANVFCDWVAFPSLKKGWSSKLHNVCHEMNDMYLGYGHVRTGSGVENQKTMYPTFTIDGDVHRLNGTVALAQDVKAYGMGTIDVNSLKLFMYKDVHTGDNISHINLSIPAPLCPASYWRLGVTGMLANFVLRTNRVYQAWQNRTSGLFRRSELKNLLSFPSYNLARELKMNTPDPNLAKNAEHILGIMGCGASGYSPAFTNRSVNRKLGNSMIHSRSSTGVYGNGGVPLDADILVSPYAGSASGVEDMFFSAHLLSFLTGLFSENLRSLKLPFCYRFNADGTITTIATGALMTPVALVEGNPNSGIHRLDVSLTPPALAIVQHDATADPASLAISKQRTSNVSGANEFDYFPIGDGPMNRFHSGLVGGTVRDPSSSTTWSASSWTDFRNTVAGSTKDPISMLGSDHHTDSSGGNNDDTVFISFEESGHLVNYSGMRTYYHYFKPLDGDETRVTVTTQGLPNATDYIHENAVDNVEVFNFRLEVAQGIHESNGTTYDLIPGHRDIFKVWNVFETATTPTTAAAFATTDWDTVVPSLCASFGTASYKSDSFSNVPGLAGFALDDIPVMKYLGGVMDGKFDNAQWIQYLETRLGGLPGSDGSGAEPADILKWRGAGAKVFLYDQDVLDHSEGLLGSLLYITYGITHPGQLTYAAVLSNDGGVEWELRDSYGWGDVSSTITEDFMATESNTGDIEPLH